MMPESILSLIEVSSAILGEIAHKKAVLQEYPTLEECQSHKNGLEPVEFKYRLLATHETITTPVYVTAVEHDRMWLVSGRTNRDKRRVGLQVEIDYPSPKEPPVRFRRVAWRRTTSK
jgi:hypothetical protein